MIRRDTTYGLSKMEYVLQMSYGIGSLSCLGAIEAMRWPLDRVVHCDIWATDTMLGAPPYVLEFQSKVDEFVKKTYGIDVEHVCAMRDGEKLTYEKMFYSTMQGRSKRAGTIFGFPVGNGWCFDLKKNALSNLNVTTWNKSRTIQYLGIMSDEHSRIEKNDIPRFRMPLVSAGWSRDECLKWCENRDLIYPNIDGKSAPGCWFCHRQTVGSLRVLRRDYPELWGILLRWAADSPTSFMPHYVGIADFEKRFAMEDRGEIPSDAKFRWSMIK